MRWTTRQPGRCVERRKPAWVTVANAVRRQGPLACALLAALIVAGCAPANERPLRGAVPGTDAAATPPGVPPTLTASDALRLKPVPVPSPGIASSPSASPVASPSVVVAAPIVRTIAPGANGHVPSGAPVTLSAVLVGRGADLASASLSVNGVDAGAQIDKRSARDWTIHASQSLGNGMQTARVLVRDADGGSGGFTWQFAVGDEAPPAAEPPAPATAPTAAPSPAPAAPRASPAPKPRSP
jgi:pyruvate dehydrogenase E2 component (dihydrolipoamide acetyltransferase)